MCTGLEWLMGLSAIAGIGGTVASLTQKTPDPPELPALAPPEDVEEEPDVRLGTEGASDDTGAGDKAAAVFAAKRTTGNSLGNLGRSSLSI